MFLKEVKDTLKQAGSIMAFLVVMPLIYLLDSSFYKTGTTIIEYIGGGFALLWMIAVGYLAYNMFRPEEKDNAVEYILSLPISHWKLLICKLLPRITVLLALNLLTVFLCSGHIWFYNLSGLLTFVVFSQVCGFTLGIVGRRSWITRLMLFFMMICAFIINSIPLLLIWKDSFPASSLLNIIVQLGFLVLILIPIYRNWDLKPVRARELSFAKIAIVPLIVLAFPVVWLFSS